jgi:hypothetical protein
MKHGAGPSKQKEKKIRFAFGGNTPCHIVVTIFVW